MIREFHTIRDFLLLHYWANDRDEPYWKERTETALPTSLADRIALWREQGRVERDEHELFGESGWIAVLLGQGIIPSGYSNVADTIAEPKLARHLERIRTEIRRTVQTLDSHQKLIERLRAAPTRLADELAEFEHSRKTL